MGSLLSRCLFHFLPTHLLTFWLQTRLSVNWLSETDMLISILKECPLITYMLECFPRTIKQAMTVYKILNNIIEINPPTGLLTRSHNRHHFTIPRSRLNTVVYSFYPRAIRIWNKIPKEITEIKQPESFHAAISKLPFTTLTQSKMLAT